ncbi:MAG: hypothetical protein Q9209_005994 [Squamulea sp. 1 TL-2023]
MVSDHGPITVNVDAAMHRLLELEDTDRDDLITIDDQGPKVRFFAASACLVMNEAQNFPLGKYSSHQEATFDVQGVYQLSNLLQELFLARQHNLTSVTIKRAQLEEDPVHRLSRLIQTVWWDNLTRQLDADGIDRAAPDNLTQRRDAAGMKRAVSDSITKSPLRIYIPPGAPEQFAYYSEVAKDYPAISLDVRWLPDGVVTAEFIKSINNKPGILALDMEVVQLKGQPATMKGVPFIVPGGQFNELYNWDACFCALGMLDNRLSVVKGIVKNFIFEIKHYGKILNANRSYYLGRAQPPLLTWLALKVFHRTKHEPDASDNLRSAILAARKEYHMWWTSTPRLDEASGLSRYRPSKYSHLSLREGWTPPLNDLELARDRPQNKYGMTLEEVSEAYNNGTLTEPDLDTFFDHDRAVRESGHDTSNRFEGVCADLATVDLNCLLLHIENNIASTIQTHFDDSLTILGDYSAPGDRENMVESSDIWRERAERRKASIDKHLWNEQKGIYLDYNTVTKKQSIDETVTCIWSLWCGAANKTQAERLVKEGLPKFERIGGLSSTSESTRGTVTEANPQKQWDYPYGWAPHQVLAWDGLRSYGYYDEADRLTYRWLHMITETFRNWNGTVVEKYDVTQLERSHHVDAEYGNQGRNFKYAPQEGPSQTQDDAVLRNVFDSQSCWRDFQHSFDITKTSTDGLFCNHYLTHPHGFLAFSKATLQKCQQLVATVVDASTTEQRCAIPYTLDRLSDSLCRVLDMADFVRSTHPDSGWRQASTQAYAMLFEFMNVLNTTPDLKVQLEGVVGDPSIKATWNDEETMVAQILLKDFSRSAIDLPKEKRKLFVDLSNRIRQLGNKFTEDMRPETSSISFHHGQLKYADALVMQHATRRHPMGISIPTVGPVAVTALLSMRDEAARRKLYIAGKTAPETQLQTLEEFLLTRAKVAHLSGYRSYAHMNLSDKLAKTPAAVNLFLSALLKDNEWQAQQELEELLVLKKFDREENDASVRIEAWDQYYYQNQQANKQKWRSRGSDFMSAYFSLGTVMQGLSRLFAQLYGVRFVPVPITPGEVWDPNVRRLDVIDENEGRIAVLYCDLFARPGKSPNPAHFTLRCSRRISATEIQEASMSNPDLDPIYVANDGMATSHIPSINTTYQLPTIALICDFQQPHNTTSYEPILLSFRSMQTLFHEMGHAIHSILGRTAHQVVSGTRCATDFAELPSVLMEHFAADPHVLALFARHWQTDAPLPYDMVAEHLANERRGQGLETEHQILLAMLDQAYHSDLPLSMEGGFDSTKVLQDVWDRYGSVKQPRETSVQGFFGHLVEYGGTYYSYLFDRAIAGKVWQEIFEGGKDGAAVKRESGQKFRDEVLKWGGSRDGWKCLAGLLGDERLRNGGPEAMAEVGKWGIKD